MDTLEQVELKIQEVQENLSSVESQNTITQLKERLNYLKEKRADLLLESTNKL